MTIEFERCRRDIAGKGTTITSWYDERTKTWHASAPAFSHLLSGGGGPSSGFGSRNSAIERVVSTLTNQMGARK